jgi:hypothetical protein
MNQRIKRSGKGKGNRTDFVGVNTGGLQSRMTPKKSDVQIPQKATGELPEEKNLQGLAKASPKFKPIEAPVEKVSAEEQSRILEEQAEVVSVELDDDDVGEDLDVNDILDSLEKEED